MMLQTLQLKPMNTKIAFWNCSGLEHIVLHPFLKSSDSNTYFTVKILKNQNLPLVRFKISSEFTPEVHASHLKQ